MAVPPFFGLSLQKAGHASLWKVYEHFTSFSLSGSEINPVSHFFTEFFAEIETYTCGLFTGTAEDNELNREIAVELLAATGVKVETAENGKIAVEKVQSSPPGYYQLIFMDVQMPVMDGCTAATAIRNLERNDTKTLPIVAMTANAFADDRQRTKEAGMNDHLEKPIDIERLHQVLHRYLI